MSCPNKAPSGARPLLVVALLLGCGLAPGARALELVPRVDFKQGYESNPLGKQSGREIDDFVTRINPSLRLNSKNRTSKGYS